MKIKKPLNICLLLALAIFVLAGCASSDSDGNLAEERAAVTTDTHSSEGKGNESDTALGNDAKSSFTNDYGTSTTQCAHSGCTNYIASSGDTNCCTVHSNKCLECGKYIDEDAIYCMDCIEKALESDTSSKSSSGKSSSSYSSSSSSSGQTGAGGYDMPNENDASFSDYVKRVDPELYASLFE